MKHNFEFNSVGEAEKCKPLCSKFIQNTTCQILLESDGFVSDMTKTLSELQ